MSLGVACNRLFKEVELQSPVQAQALLRIDQVAERVQYGRSSIWAMVKAGTFPAPVKLSRRCTRWTNVQVDEWIQQRIHHEAGR